MANENVRVDLAQFGEEEAQKAALVSHDVAGEPIARLGYRIREIEREDFVRRLRNAWKVGIFWEETEGCWMG